MRFGVSVLLCDISRLLRFHEEIVSALILNVCLHIDGTQTYILQLVSFKVRKVELYSKIPSDIFLESVVNQLFIRSHLDYYTLLIS